MDDSNAQIDDDLNPPIEAYEDEDDEEEEIEDSDFEMEDLPEDIDGNK